MTIRIQHRFESSGPATPQAILVGWTRPKGEGEDTLQELALLAQTAGAQIVAEIRQRRSSVHPGNFLSRGKLEEAKLLVEATHANLLLSDEDLSPAQVRNLEEALKLRVVDRSELILDIFAQRATSREAQTQVELAQLRYLLPRLTGMWGHLSRTGGGIGTRGPGETQLEVDRRRVREKISSLERRLERVEVERATQRQGRREAFRVSLVGYTNAGKSTVFNRLTGASVLAEDKLFATLDTITRRLQLGPDFGVLISDTVGFIRKLPHHLVASFRATLREVENADLIVHVVDASHPAREQQIGVVEDVLQDILPGPVPRLLVLNKTDLVEDETQQLELRLRYPDAILVSALSEADGPRLKEAMARVIRELWIHVRVECPAPRLPELRELTQRGEQRVMNFHDGRVWCEFWLDRPEVAKLRRAGFRVETLSLAGKEELPQVKPGHRLRT